MNNHSQIKVAGAIVLYNSEISVIDNIKSYINQVDTLFVVDNSETINESLIMSLETFFNIKYIFNGQNLGIANALNIAANAAINHGFDYLLTMDDDTLVPDNMVARMVTFLSERESDKIGILAAQSTPHLAGESHRYVYVTITSGNLLNLKAYKQCGPFLEKLFIDWVDHEYCMRLARNGYSVIELNYLLLNHRLGIRKHVSILGKTIHWTSHNPTRVYYRFRNTSYVMWKYAFYIPSKYYLIFMYELLKDVSKNMWLEDKRLYRSKMMLKGVLDCCKGKMGRYDG
ncbi:MULTISPECIES: glycosyltransferase [Spirosoma]|uniref:Glycosyltransferase n=1 Tax=Spirosoma sordidisoli TaxID=2502893 RepID=A0A4Q2UGP4_9BACT|nr:MULTISPECIES: glycosyltransferase [Spirosoma]RYC68543.1 glycosyltransferase [Spirosoma sordidisoli]